MTEPEDSFEDLQPSLMAAAAVANEDAALVVNIEGFEGPLDVLLMLARTQKVDLTQISILELVEQYLVFVTEARKLRLELAADYLVMAAWLAYLKSRLLLPKEEDGEGPSAEEMAYRLQMRLQRLEAMREAGARLMGRNRLGRDIFANGNAEGVVVLKRHAYDATLYELLRAYADHTQRTSITELKIHRRPVYSLEAALVRLQSLLGGALDWTQIQSFLPDGLKDKGLRKSAIASMFTASLELARQGQLEIRQLGTFGPLYLRQSNRSDDDPPLYGEGNGSSDEHETE